MSSCFHNLAIPGSVRRFAALRALAVAMLALATYAHGQGPEISVPGAPSDPQSVQQAFDVLPTPGPSAATALTLADLEQLALQNNPSLGVARANIGAARGRQIQSGLLPNPTIGYMASDIGEDDTAGSQG